MSQLRAGRRPVLECAARRLVHEGGLAEPQARALVESIRGGVRYRAASPISPTSSAPGLVWIVDGWCCEFRALFDGRRQIFSFAIPGDMVRVDPAADRTFAALTAVECVDVAQILGCGLEPERSALLTPLLRAVVADGERRYDHLSRLSRRAAISRTAHLLVELHDRLDDVGLVTGDAFPLPLTQEHIADALGLSPAQVNRSLRSLREVGAATLRFGRATGFDRERLSAFAAD